MARKKANAEPQDGQEPILPAEELAAGEVGPAPVEGVLDNAIPADGEVGGEPTDFPGTDDSPFMVGQEGGASTQGEVPMEQLPQDADNAAVGTAPDAEPAPGGGEEDYAAVLQAVKESGGMETVPRPESAPLLLCDAEEESSGGDQPPHSEEPAADSGPSVERPASSGADDRRPSPLRERDRVLTIDPRAEVQTQEDLEDIVWHELQNANRTRHTLTGTLDSVERTDNGMTAAIVRYKGFKVMIPLKEMMVHTGQVPNGPEFSLWVDQVTRILHARQNSDIDFVVRGVDNESRTVVGSRRDAMLRKRKRFYLDTDELGRHMIEEGRIVQARVVAVADKVIRVEVFGVECNVAVRGFSRMWVGSVRDEHYVGELILVRVQKIERNRNPEKLRIQVDERCINGDALEKLSQCKPQCRYVGQVTDVRRGVVYIRLNNGANAIAHTCYDRRMPGKKDTVSFAVTRLDEKRGIAIGIITRIIKQNL